MNKRIAVTLLTICLIGLLALPFIPQNNNHDPIITTDTVTDTSTPITLDMYPGNTFWLNCNPNTTTTTVSTP